MNGFVAIVIELMDALKRISERKWSFLGIFAIAFLASTFVLAQADLLPEAPGVSAVAANVEETVEVPAAVAVAELPVKIEIPAIKLSARVANPESTDAKVLDEELLKGAVRYPTSAKLGETGNVVLFGHSSYLPIVGNEAYKTFDDIQKLKAGATISVFSEGTVYTYAVRGVEKKSANDGVIELSQSGRVLTLVTCNSFASKEDRFVITADLVSQKALPTANFVESHPAST